MHVLQVFPEVVLSGFSFILLEIPHFANLHFVLIGSIRHDRAFLINWRREAGAFRTRIDSFKKNSCETPLLPSSIHKKQQCHPERSEGSHNSIYQSVKECCH